ncbi:hypothetical protein HKD37_07G018205 [Glycine soja]
MGSWSFLEVRTELTAIPVVKECLVFSDQASFPPIICFQILFNRKPLSSDRDSSDQKLTSLNRCFFICINLGSNHGNKVSYYLVASANGVLYSLQIGVMMKHFDLGVVSLVRKSTGMWKRLQLHIKFDSE